MTLGDLQYESFHYFTFLRRTNRKIYGVVIFVYFMLVTLLTLISVNTNIITKGKWNLTPQSFTLAEEIQIITSRFFDVTSNISLYPMYIIFFAFLKLLLLPVLIRRVNDTDLHSFCSVFIVIFYLCNFILTIGNSEKTTIFISILQNIHLGIIILLFILPSSTKKDFL